MIFPLFRRAQRPDTISTLYGMIVAQARLPCFYQDCAVADTVNGRFDLLALHVALVMERFAAESELQSLGQGLFDRFWQDIDHNLREMGVGDLAVPKRMRKLGEAYYGRARAYREALASDDAGLAEAVRRNVYAGVEPPADALLRLCAYMRQAAVSLAAQSSENLARGTLGFPDPAALVDPLSSVAIRD